MKFFKTPLDGAYIIELEKLEDNRGFFSRLYCSKEFNNHNLNNTFVQVNNSLSKNKGTLRGIHYQKSPMAESKLVRCISGGLYDVIVDLRANSKTYKHWFGITLSNENRKMIFVPEGFGHAFLTLEDNTEAIYFVSQYYSPKHESGLIWNDKEIGIQWPIKPLFVSDKDKNNPSFDSSIHKLK
tara:strand:- start:375 stop:923 length:549 start_codon:yes stop_codon:yes gene_type:complete